MSTPFGIELYKNVSELNAVDALVDMKFLIAAPNKHPMFDEYVVQATPTLGVVWIKGISAYKDVDPFGHNLCADVDRIADQLTLKYGNPKKSDFVLSGSLWDEPQYWMNALEEGTRYYCYLYSAESGANLPDDLESVYVGAMSGGNNVGAVTIEYSSPRVDEAHAEIQAGLADLL